MDNTGSVGVVWLPIWLMEKIIGGLGKLVQGNNGVYNCAKVITGTYLIGNGMGSGCPVSYYYEIKSGDVVAKKRGQIIVSNGDHNRSVSRMSVIILYPKTDKVHLKIHRGNDIKDVKLVRVKDKKYTMFRMHI